MAQIALLWGGGGNIISTILLIFTYFFKIFKYKLYKTIIKIHNITSSYLCHQSYLGQFCQIWHFLGTFNKFQNSSTYSGYNCIYIKVISIWIVVCMSYQPIWLNYRLGNHGNVLSLVPKYWVPKLVMFIVGKKQFSSYRSKVIYLSRKFGMI